MEPGIFVGQLFWDLFKCWIIFVAGHATKSTGDVRHLRALCSQAFGNTSWEHHQEKWGLRTTMSKMPLFVFHLMQVLWEWTPNLSFLYWCTSNRIRLSVTTFHHRDIIGILQKWTHPFYFIVQQLIWHAQKVAGRPLCSLEMFCIVGTGLKFEFELHGRSCILLHRYLARLRNGSRGAFTCTDAHKKSKLEFVTMDSQLSTVEGLFLL